MSKDVRIIHPVDAPRWLDPVIKDVKGGLRTKQDEDSDLNAIAALETTGLVARTAEGIAATRSIAAPPAGVTVSNGNGVAGNPTLGLANDLAGLEGLGGIGFAVRSAADTWVQRALAGTANEIAVANGDGAAANPTLSLPVALTFSGKTITGGAYATIASVSIDDANFALDILASFPTVTFDTNDVWRYNRSTNSWAWRIGGSDVLTLSATTLAGAGITCTSLSVDDTNFAFDIVSSNPTITLDADNDRLRFVRSTNTLQFTIGGNNLLTLNNTGQLVLTGASSRLDLTDRDGDDGTPWALYNQSDTLRFFRAGSDRLSIDASGALKLPSFTVTGVPSATIGAGSLIYVPDESGGGVIAFSDGASWRRVTDLAIIS